MRSSPIVIFLSAVVLIATVATLPGYDVTMCSGGISGTTSPVVEPNTTDPTPGTVTANTSPHTTGSPGPIYPAPLTLKWGDTAYSRKLAVTVAAPVDDTFNLGAAELPFLGPDKKAIYCMVTISNRTSSETIRYSPVDFTIYDASGEAYHFWNMTSLCTQPYLRAGELPPGQTVSGIITVALPWTTSVASVDFRDRAYKAVVVSWSD